MAQIAPNSDTAKNQRKVKRLAMLYNLDRLDVRISPVTDIIEIFAIKGDKTREATINQSIIDWRNVEHVVSALFGKTENLEEADQ
jgi:metal-responsive CopG/Arc/MetJ family transcriptional regulator